MRFALKLRVQNPNENTLVYDGMSVNLNLDGRGLASGVSNTSGEIPRFSDAVLTVPVSISAFSVVRQLLARAGAMESDEGQQPIAYSLKGKLGAPAGSLGAVRFSARGDLNLFASGSTAE
jgi:LEA14-like dessication related protein